MLVEKSKGKQIEGSRLDTLPSMHRRISREVLREIDVSIWEILREEIRNKIDWQLVGALRTRALRK